MKIAVLGYGVVGSGVVEVLAKNRQSIEKKAGCPMEVAYILDRKDLTDALSAGKQVRDFSVILGDPQVDMVVEAMGGITPAYDYVKAALEAGKNVVTSNKELVAAKGAQLLALAKEKNINFLFEASVGGGIPIIHPLHQCLGANQISEIAGILNGTTNFILTKMIREGMSFTQALALAQQLGYAEADPTADVEGLDACRKICILASLAFGSHLYPDGVYTQGITKITPEDVQYAESAGCVIKLVGRAAKGADGKVQAMVSPALLHRDSQLAGIDDVFNGILVRGDATGDVVFYGRGAGKLPTASAVVADIIDAARASGTIDTLQWEDSDGNNLAPVSQYPVTAYLRWAYTGKGEAEAFVTQVLGPCQQLRRPGQPEGEWAFLTTQPLTEAELEQGIQQLEKQGFEMLSLIRQLDY